MKVIDYVALALVAIGTVNWGLIGILDFDLVSALFGNMSILSRIIYTIIGICGIYSLSYYGRIRSME